MNNKDKIFIWSRFEPKLRPINELDRLDELVELVDLDELVKLNESKCSCVFDNNSLVSYYWIGLFNGCISCMKKFKNAAIQDYGSITKICPCCNKINGTCPEQIEINYITSRSTYKALELFVTNTNIDRSRKIDILIQYNEDVKYFLINKFLKTLFPLSYGHICKLLGLNWIPNKYFWTQHIKQRQFKTILKVKLYIENNKTFKISKNKLKKIIKQFRKVTDLYVAMKINLYIIKRSNLICNDLLNMIEYYIM